MTDNWFYWRWLREFEAILSVTASWWATKTWMKKNAFELLEVMQAKVHDSSGLICASMWILISFKIFRLCESKFSRIIIFIPQSFESPRDCRWIEQPFFITSRIHVFYHLHTFRQRQADDVNRAATYIGSWSSFDWGSFSFSHNLFFVGIQTSRVT